MGSVFSPYYAWARGRGRSDPLHHCALNVALYGTSGPSWACTERGRGSVRRSESDFGIGRSTLRWTGSCLEVEIDEVTAPLPRRLRGTVRLHPPSLSSQVFDLDSAGRHRWWPISPFSRVEVDLGSPGLRWSGPGYLDSNDGDEPLAEAFGQWHWSRASLRDETAVLYEVHRRNGGKASVALRFDRTGAVHDEDLPSEATLPRTAWGVERETRADEGCAPDVVRTLENGPFYARSLLRTRLFGETVTAMHESLSLDRFRKPWVQLMLPFRMPRLG